MNVNQILQAIQNGQLSDSELRTINETLIARLKTNRKVASTAAKATLSEGMMVRVNHPQLADRKFILTSIKRTKASVRPVGELVSSYRVPLVLVEAI